MKRYVLVITLLFFCLIRSYAQDTPQIKKSEKIETIDGKQYYMHTVEKGQTLYSISKAYNITRAELIQTDSSFNALKLGQIVKIPFKGNNDKETAKVTPVNKEQEPIVHIVQKKETLFGIAKKYNVTEEKLIELNPELKNSTLKPGQQIKITSNNAVEKKTTKITNEEVKKKASLKVEEKKIVNAKDEPIKEEAKVDKVVEKETNSNCEKIKSKKTYNIALLIPLYLKNLGDINPDNVQLENKTAHDYKSFSFIQFYEGFMMAVDTLVKQGLNVKIYTYDVPDTTALPASSMRKLDLDKMDLIVGPFFNKAFKSVAEFAKEHKISVINPFTERRTILDKNPYVFKIIPSPQDEIHNVVSFIITTYPKANVIIVHNNKDTEKKRAELYKKDFNESYKDNPAKEGTVKEVIYNQVGFDGLNSKLSDTRENIIITLMESEISVTGYVSRLGNIKDLNIVLFGTPYWKNLDKIETEYFQKLNMHLYEPNFVDYDDELTKSFIFKFRDKYKTEPIEMAYSGNDIATYFLTALMNYGEDFSGCLSNVKVNTLQTKYIFRKTGEDNGYENTYLNIYHLKEYKFKDARK